MNLKGWLEMCLESIDEKVLDVVKMTGALEERNRILAYLNQYVEDNQHLYYYFISVIRDIEANKHFDKKGI